MGLQFEAFYNLYIFVKEKKETQMLRQYTNELKNYNFQQKITEGYFIDAKDEGRWKVGRIQQIRKIGHKLCIEVMFDGYLNKYNETYDLPSYSKLAPFRRFTVPYTGDLKYDPRRQQPSKSLQHYIKMVGKISGDMSNWTSEQINQIVRGQLFVYVDYCMTLSARQEVKYPFDEYMRLLFAYLEMVEKVLERVIQFLKEVEKQGNMDQNLIYVYPKMSWLYAVTEMLFNCNSMVSRKQQRATFHQFFAKHQSHDAIYNALNKKIDALKIYDKCQKLMNFKLVNSGKSLPWSIKKQVLILMKSLNPQQKVVLPKDTKQVIQFIEYLPYLTQKTTISKQDQEKYRNELIFHLILNGNFEGKLIGLNELKRSIASIQSLHLNYRKQKQEEEAIYTDLIKEKNLIGFFLDNKNFNSELFKRSLIVFEFTYRHKMFTKQHFPLVLKLHKDKHELQLKNFYTSLAEFGSFMDPNDAIECFNFILKQLPVEENFIELIKNFTISTIDKNPYYKKLYMSKDEHGFGLIYFWDLINGQVKINKNLIPKVIESFAHLLNNVFFSRQIQRFIVSSIKAIKDVKNPEFFLKVIHESIKLCKGTKMNKAIETAQKEINVIEAAMSMLRQQESNLSSSGFENLFEFLQEVNHISRKGLTQSDIISLWKMDKQKCRSHLLKFLRKYKLRSNEQKSQQRIVSKSLDILQIQFIIKNIFQFDQMMEGYTDIDMDHYDTIDELILCYLHTKKIIEYNYKHTIRYKKNEFFLDDDKMFLGMNFYLKCIEHNHEKYSDVVIKAIRRLVEIFLRPLKDEFPTKSYNDVKAKNWIRLSKAFDSLKNSRLKCFQIQLVEIYGRIKSLNILSLESIEIRVKQTSSNKTYLFTVPRYTSLWKFRLLINDKFDLKDTNFQIQLIEQNTTTNLQREEDLSVAFICCAKQKNVVSVSINPSKQQHPHFKTIDKFKEELCDMIGEGLYKNLSLPNQQKSSDSLDILFNLPFLKTLQKSIQSLDFKQWQQILDSHNMKKMEYQLRVIQKIKEMKWTLGFLSKGGLKHLAEVVIQNLGKGHYKTLNLLMTFFLEAIQFTQKSPLPFGESFLKDILFYEKEKTDDYVSFLNNCFNLIRYSSQKIKLPSFFQKQKMAQILEYVLFTNKKSTVSAQILEICKTNNSYLNLNKHMRAFLNFDYLKTKMNECCQFFEVLRMLIERGQLSGISQQVEQLLLSIRNSDIKQKSQNQVNELLFGYLSCVYEFIKVNRLEDILAESKEKFFMYLLNECLFHPQNIAFRKFKSKQLRELGFKFLEMLEFETKKDNAIDKLLIPMMAKGSWRKQFDWAIEPVEFVNKNFTGLKNLAATCYINSLLQQLFYIKNFSSQLMAIDAQKIQDKQNIVRQIQNIFGFLKYSQNPSHTTASLCHNFILDGQPIDPRIQTDVDEFFHALMDKLQRNLQKVNKKQIINEVFRGQFSNMIIGQECPHASERIEHFLSIRLEIKNKKTIYQALDEFIKGQILEGENAYFCEKCDKKVKALKRVCLKELPPVMIVTLKRFEFDFDTMQKFKLNTYCSFPENINFLPYTKQGLQEDSDVKKEDYEYKLKGVIIHYGISEAGHYTSYVRTDKKSWNYFDDQRISEFDLKEMENQCFGGIEENPFGDDEQKKKNAYLLIYEKVKTSQELKQIPEQALTQSQVYHFVEQDNVKTKMVNLLFEPNIQNYIFNLSEANPRVFLIYYHTVFLRSSRRADKYVEFYQKASELLTQKHIATWYLAQITESFLMEFLQFGEYQVRYIVASLIIQAMKICVDLQFIQQCVALLSTKTMMPLVKIFGIAPILHQDYAKYLSSINFGEVILNLIKGKQIKETSVIKKAQSRKNVSEFGMAASSFIDRKIFDIKDLFQAIESIKTGITFDEIKENCTQIRSLRTLRSLAIITARKYKDLDQFKKLLGQFLVEELSKFEPKIGEEGYFSFWLQVIQELCKIKDKDQEQRVITLVKFYVDLMKDALIGFKCELMLFNGFFRMALTNPVFKNIVSNMVLNDKDNKKLVTSLKDWLKDLPNVIPNIKNDKWGWWKKSKRQYQGLTTEYVNNEVKPGVKEALSMLNAIIEKHPIEQVSEYLEPGNNGYIEQKNRTDNYTVERKIGFLVEIKDEHSNRRFVCEDEVVKKFI